MLIDRRGRATISTADVDPTRVDRFKFDHSDDEYDEQSLVFSVDPHSDRFVAVPLYWIDRADL